MLVAINLKKCHIKLGRYYVEHQLTETKFRVNKEVKFRFRFRCLLQLANKFISTYPGRQRLPGINSITEILQDSHQDDTRSETAGFRLKGRKISGYMLTEKTSTYDSACVQIKNSITNSGVQMLLDAWGQRGSWMPSNPRKYFRFVPRNLISDDLFVTIYENSLLGCTPRLHHTLVTTLFSLLFCHVPTFCKRKLAPWMPPRLDARGRRTVRTPLCMPLITNPTVCYEAW